MISVIDNNVLAHIDRLEKIQYLLERTGGWEQHSDPVYRNAHTRLRAMQRMAIEDFMKVSGA